jgi:hypothetical protein
MRPPVSKPLTAAWYVSGHGWGHASRQREVIREINRRLPGLGVAVISTVPGWFWESLPNVALCGRASGPVPFEAPGTTDLPATREILAAFLSDWRRALSREIEFLGSVGADLVVSDIEALPFEAARILGMPALGIANFTWDWVFRNLGEGFGEVGDLLAGLYSSGTYLRLPLGPSEQPFCRCIDMPLLPGGTPRDPERARRLFRPGPLMVVTLRDPGRLAGSSLLAPVGWQVVTSLPEEIPGVTRNIHPAELEKLGLRFADLVACADTVLLTPGYGIVSQVLAWGSRAVVIRRHEFPEAPYLMGALEGRAGTVISEAVDLLGDGLERAALRSLEGPPPVAVGGGGLEACAERVQAVVESGTPGLLYR